MNAIINPQAEQIKIFDKHSRVDVSPVYLAFQILNEFSKNPKRLKLDKKVSIYEVFNKLKKMNELVPTKQIFFALIFLYLIDAVEFDKPFVIIRKKHA